MYVTDTFEISSDDLYNLCAYADESKDFDLLEKEAEELRVVIEEAMSKHLGRKITVEYND